MVEAPMYYKEHMNVTVVLEWIQVGFDGFGQTSVFYQFALGLSKMYMYPQNPVKLID